MKTIANQATIGGVCAGLAHKIGINRIWVRIIFLIFIASFFGDVSKIILIPGIEMLQSVVTVGYILIWSFADSINLSENSQILRQNHWIGVVCGGLGARYSIDPLWVRTGFGVSIICFGLGLSLYLLLWFSMPE